MMHPADLVKLTTPEFFASGDPHELWKRMRSEAPVAWTPEQNGPGFWSVTRYDDGAGVLRDWQTFSSARGTTLEGNRWEDDPAGGQMLALTDPERHTGLRRIIQPFFAPSALRAVERDARAYLRAELARCVGMDSFDFVAHVANRLPVHVLFTMLGVRSDDWTQLFDVILRTMAPDPAERHNADYEMLVYLSGLADARRRVPGDDLLSAIATAELSDGPLSHDEVVLNFASLLSAGVSTTRLALSGGMHALMAYPAQWRALRLGRATVLTAVEEIVRWTSPGLAFYRTATKRTVIGAQTIEPESRVMVWVPSMNRDEAAFDHADKFDVSRARNRHAGFGTGIHACVGAALARIELRLALEELLALDVDLDLASAPTRMSSLVLQGIEALPVRPVPTLARQPVEYRDPRGEGR